MPPKKGVKSTVEKEPERVAGDDVTVMTGNHYANNQKDPYVSTAHIPVELTLYGLPVTDDPNTTNDDANIEDLKKVQGEYTIEIDTIKEDHNKRIDTIREDHANEVSALMERIDKLA